METIRVYAPATVANVACGFDVLGFALNEPGDELVLRKNNLGETRILSITGDEGKLPLNPQKNTAGVVIEHFLRYTDQKQGFDIELHKKMPLGSGLGSSAASAAAALFAVNQLMGKPLTNAQLVAFAVEGERAACGSAHADNVAPALLGGFVLIRSYEPLDIIPIATPSNLMATVIHPHIEIRTEDARNILKKSILLKDAVTQWGNIGGLIAGLMKNDLDLIRRSLQDVIVEPIRALLIPHFDEIKSAAMQAGALGCSISGSGPSIFALSHQQIIAQNIGKAMQESLLSIGIESDLYVSPINLEGTRILD